MAVIPSGTISAFLDMVPLRRKKWVIGILGLSLVVALVLFMVGIFRNIFGEPLVTPHHIYLAGDQTMNGAGLTIVGGLLLALVVG